MLWFLWFWTRICANVVVFVVLICVNVYFLVDLVFFVCANVVV